MQSINRIIEDSIDGPNERVEARDVFQLITGTSTGGLIALMLGRMNMTVDQCITQYFGLARAVFGTRSKLGRFTKGLAKPRYYPTGLQNCIERLLTEQGLEVGLHMQDPRKTTACAVVCTRHADASRFEPDFEDGVCICSLSCHELIPCTVCDAAHATSAAATYFLPVLIGQITLSDGGFLNNNPSWQVLDHYGTRNPATPANAHYGNGDLDWSSLRFVNIGTGASERKRDVSHQRTYLNRHLVPGAYRMMKALIHNLKRAAVDSEKIAGNMKIVQDYSDGKVFFHRLSATHQVYSFKLDDYKHLHDIEQRTLAYLREENTQADIQKIAKEVATDYIDRRGLTARYSPDHNATETTVTEDLGSGHSNIEDMNQTSAVLQPEISDNTTGASGGESRSRRSGTTAGTTPVRDDSTEAESLNHTKDSSQSENDEI